MNLINVTLTLYLITYLNFLKDNVMFFQKDIVLVFVLKEDPHRIIVLT